MRPRISIRGCVRPSVRPPFFFEHGKSTKKRVRMHCLAAEATCFFNFFYLIFFLILGGGAPDAKLSGLAAAIIKIKKKMRNRRRRRSSRLKKIKYTFFYKGRVYKKLSLKFPKNIRTI